MELLESATLIAGGGAGGFGGAWVAIKVHISYLQRDNQRQDDQLADHAAALRRIERKADRANDRIDQLQGGTL